MNFWQQKSLSELSKNEWESLCDGCAKCCLKKLEDFDTSEVFYTSVACDLLNLTTCQCADYQNRNTLVPECIWLTPKDAGHLSWLPKTCAYRILAEGKDLPDWHPLLSGNKQTVFDAGVAINSYAITGVADEQLEYFIIEH